MLENDLEVTGVLVGLEARRKVMVTGVQRGREVMVAGVQGGRQVIAGLGKDWAVTTAVTWVAIEKRTPCSDRFMLLSSKMQYYFLNLKAKKSPNQDAEAFTRLSPRQVSRHNSLHGKG